MAQMDPNFLSVLTRCPLQSMSALTRFHCITFWSIFRDQKAGFRALTSQSFDIVAWKQFQNVPTVRKNTLIYGLHHFGGVSGPLLTKYYILVHFAGKKAGFRALTSQYSDIVAWKQCQNVPTVRRNAFIYGLHHFREVSGRLLSKYYILVHFACKKRRVLGPNVIVF